ncbi:unnamed protein product [Urochloa humidicola]
MTESHTVLHGSSSTDGGKNIQIESREIGGTTTGPAQAVQTAKTCRRCGLKGHLLFECSTEVYCDICRNGEHALSRCPVTRQPKPVVQLVGHAVDALAAFHIPHAPIQPVKKDTRFAKVIVMGEAMNEIELGAALRLSIKDNYEWDIQRKEDSVFKVLFPTRTDLIRATRFNIGLENGATLKFEEYLEDEEYFGHALPVVWMRVLNLPSILREYVVLWALGTLFGVTQEVDIVTTNANKFGRFAVAVLEPEAIPTRLDVIIGNRYFQLIFEVEPFQPNIGLKSKRMDANGDQDDKGNAAKEDTVMKENDGNLGGSVGKQSAGANIHDMNAKSFSNTAVHEDKNMDVDWENDDLLGEEHELSVAASTFLGVKKGEQLNVMRASTFASARTPSVAVRIADQKNKSQLELVTPTSKGDMDNKKATPKVDMTTTGQAKMSSGKRKVTVQLNDNTQDMPSTQVTNSEERGRKMFPKAQKNDKVGVAASGEATDLGGLLDNMMRAGVAADGTTNRSLGSKTVMALLSPDSDGHLTPLRRSIRTAGDADVNSIEKAGIRVAIKNLEEPQGTLQRNILDPFLVIATEGGRSPCSEYGLQDA